MRFGMFAENGHPVPASSQIVANPVDTTSLVASAKLAGRLDGFEVGHMLSISGKYGPAVLAKSSCQYSTMLLVTSRFDLIRIGHPASLD